MQLQASLFEELSSPSIPATFGQTRVGIRNKAAALNKGGIDYLNCNYSLNPYVGCGFGCSYCYAAFYVADEGQRRDWGHWVDVKTDAERQIAGSDLKGQRVMMSTATDPYQPIESKVELTRLPQL